MIGIGTFTIEQVAGAYGVNLQELEDFSSGKPYVENGRLKTHDVFTLMADFEKYQSIRK